jgi:hypothetical protein
MRGGIGARVFGGSSYGGKNYIYVLGAIMGYYALTAQRIPLGKSQRMVKWFFLSALTCALSNVAYMLGPSFYVLYNLIGVNSAVAQFQSDLGQDVIVRFADIGSAASSVLFFMLARWGLRGIFKWDKPWRAFLLAAVVAASLFSGFRSQVALVAVLLAIQFIMEGLWKTAFLPLFCLLGILCLAPMLLFANRMPPAVQRSLAFLPLDINPDIRADADASTQWRLAMWAEVWPDVPKYLLLGKGYSLDPADLSLTDAAMRSGVANGYEWARTTGDYHSGPLSLLIPFGLLGTVAFLWLLAAGVKALYCNYRYGDARLRHVNMTLFAFFLAQSLFFFFVFGAFNSQLMVFLGVLGFSVSLNNGVCHKEAPKALSMASSTSMALEPA